MILVAGAGQRGDAALCRAPAYPLPNPPDRASDLSNAILQGFSPVATAPLITATACRRH